MKTADSAPNHELEGSCKKKPILIPTEDGGASKRHAGPVHCEGPGALRTAWDPKDAKEDASKRPKTSVSSLAGQVTRGGWWGEGGGGRWGRQREGERYKFGTCVFFWLGGAHIRVYICTYTHAHTHIHIYTYMYIHTHLQLIVFDVRLLSWL